MCEQKTNPEVFPMCSRCGALLVDPEDLDLSPTAEISVIYKKTTITYLQ